MLGISIGGESESRLQSRGGMSTSSIPQPFSPHDEHRRAPPIGRPTGERERGATLVEALIAIAVLASTLSGVAHLILWCRRATGEAGLSTMSVTLAASKLEQLRALAWQVDAGGRPYGDTSTNLSVDPASTGGSGLGLSGVGTLAVNTPGYFEYLDAAGAWRGSGGAPPPDAMYVRRWAIVSFARDPAHSLVFHALVMPVAAVGVDDPLTSRRAVHLSTIRTRSLP